MALKDSTDFGTMFNNLSREEEKENSRLEQAAKKYKDHIVPVECLVLASEINYYSHSHTQ